MTIMEDRPKKEEKGTRKAQERHKEDDLRANWSGPPSSYSVVVSSDMMGSHTMRVKGDKNYRVMRVK